MRVCGIDLGNPGGLVVLTDEGGSGIWPLCAEALPPRMSGLELQRRVHQRCQQHRVELVATEKPGLWGNPMIGFAQREKQGLIRAVCDALQIRLVDYQPQAVKRAVTGYGRAGKEQVGRCVCALVRIASSDEHVLDACAIALVAMRQERVRRQAGTQRRLNLRRPRRQKARQS